MDKRQKNIILGTIVFCLLVIASAVLASVTKTNPRKTSTTVSQHTISKTQLAKADGKSGRECLVAVDGTVYLIRDFSLWQDGKHLSSDGLAYCGADLSNVIDQAPHGRDILDILIKVGPLAKQ